MLYLGFKIAAKELSEAAGRTLDALIAKTIRDLRYQTFPKLFETGVVPVLNYSSEIWGFDKQMMLVKAEQ